MGLNNQDSTQATYSDQGIRTQYGIILPPGARVAAYVRSTGLQSGDDGYLATNLRATLAQGMALARPGMGDFVVCLPGHAENVSDATTFSGALVTGVRILGVGRGSNTPTFTFNATASTWTVNKADVFIQGIRIVNATNNTTSAIAVSAADFGFCYNEVQNTNGANVLQNIITASAGADRLEVSGNIIRGVGAVGGPTVILISGVIADARIIGNEIVCPSSTTNGVIQVTAAATNLKILNNFLQNNAAASVACINLGNVAITGQVANNTCGVFNTGAVVSGTTGITIGAAVLATFFQNFVVNDVQKSGILLPTADT